MAARRPRSHAGLRLRIAAVAGVAVGVVLTIGAILLVGLLRSRLHNAAETSANLRAQDVAALAAASSLPRQLAFPGEESGFVQVVDARGTVLASTENMQGEPAVAERQPVGDGPAPFTLNVVALGDAKQMRVVAINADTPTGPVIVYAGESLEGANDTIHAVSTLLALGLPALVGLVGGVTWWAVGRTLRPVRAITATLAEITASDLHRRVPAPSSRDEIGQLAT
ncbi:MAG: HAMP domain-containing protein, partial [Ilumatobacteraceae bacterium]